ncbi:MAG: hypothetical protein OEZ59_00345 [Deltaproteobacteria bacterium]|nr:hypothetical protein [Deltaproteobacteria bacterium]
MSARTQPELPGLETAEKAGAETAPAEETPQARTARLAGQFLVHSYLYYRLGETVLADEEFDRLADELRGLLPEHPEAVEPHGAMLAQALGPEASGHQIREYPPPIITTALKLLYARSGEREGVDFQEFAERRGHRVISARDKD